MSWVGVGVVRSDPKREVCWVRESWAAALLALARSWEALALPKRPAAVAGEGCPKADLLPRSAVARRASRAEICSSGAVPSLRERPRAAAGASDAALLEPAMFKSGFMVLLLACESVGL